MTADRNTEMARKLGGALHRTDLDPDAEGRGERRVGPVGPDDYQGPWDGWEGVSVAPPMGSPAAVLDPLASDVLTAFPIAPLGENPKDRLGVKKPRLSLVPPALRIYAAQGMADGARKYGPYNWRENGVKASIYVEAAGRHLDAWFDGEELAEDSGVPHLAHAIACLGILVDALETGNLIDDRPPTGCAAALIKRLTKE